MAHVTREEIDSRAAEEAATITAQDKAAQAEADATQAETTLAYGAQGECVSKLVDLLAMLGFATNNVIKGGPPILDETVLVDVRAAQAALEVKEPELTLDTDIPVGVEGELIGDSTWNALYAAAEQKIAAQEPPAAGSTPGA